MMRCCYIPGIIRLCYDYDDYYDDDYDDDDYDYYDYDYDYDYYDYDYDDYTRSVLSGGPYSTGPPILDNSPRLLLLLFSHELMATMQSVVTVQAPITLERKITSGGKQIKTEDNTHNK